MAATPFDEDAWMSALREIPEGDVWRRCHRAVIDEFERRRALPEMRREANATAAVYYSLPTHERRDGVLVWTKPPAPPFGYPAGMEVLHNGRVWLNAGEEPTVQEPGAPDTTDWVDTTISEEEPLEDE